MIIFLLFRVNNGLIVFLYIKLRELMRTGREITLNKTLKGHERGGDYFFLRIVAIPEVGGAIFKMANKEDDNYDLGY